MPRHRDESFDNSTGSNDSAIERMRRLIFGYESCEDPCLAAAFLEAHGLTYPVIANYRNILARIDQASPTAPDLDGAPHTASRPRRRRIRRARVAPPSRTYDMPHPAPSSRARSETKRYAVIVLVIELP